MPDEVPAEAKLAFGTAIVLAAIGCVLDVGIIGWLFTPICILLGAFAVLRSPLKYTMLTLMFLGLILENPAEVPAYGLWKGPFFTAGALMLTHFKTVIGGPWFFGGMDLMLLTAGATWYMDRRRASVPVGTPRPMIRLAQLCYATIVFTWIVGKARGDSNTSMGVWQMDRVMYLPAVFLLCQAAFTRPKDYVAVGKVALAAALWRACQATYVRMVLPGDVDPTTGDSLIPYTTTHHDSMLFGMAAVMLLSMIMQRASRHAWRLALLCGPILVAGMISNGRRLVWVQIILVFAAVYLITDANAFKRKVQRIILGLSPLVAGYVAAGWESTGSGFFKPVRVIRSAVDSSADGSTAWRDLENFNLIFTLRQFPLVGTGYGRGFWEVWKMPDVAYELERYIPHNSILGLWCYGGLVGYTGLTLLWVSGVFFALVALHNCKEAVEKAAALTCFGTIVIYYVQCFGDLGLGTWTGVFLVAPSLAIAGKLAVKSGAWKPAPPPRRAVRAGFPSSVTPQR